MQEDEERQRSGRGGSHAARGRARAGRERAVGAALGPGPGLGPRQGRAGQQRAGQPGGRTSLRPPGPHRPPSGNSSGANSEALAV